jgi:nuclear pore complex protein Nup62
MAPSLFGTSTPAATSNTVPAINTGGAFSGGLFGKKPEGTAATTPASATAPAAPTGGLFGGLSSATSTTPAGE